MVAMGIPTKRIAIDLKLSPRTVQTHIEHIALRIPPSAGTPRHRITVWWHEHERRAS